jgi:hypothetical protein
MILDDMLGNMRLSSDTALFHEVLGFAGTTG